MRTENSKILEERITFSGHENIRAFHKNTIEITKDLHLSNRGDCIIGVCCSRACRDLSEAMKEQIRAGRALEFQIAVEKDVFQFCGRGDKNLSLLHPTELVLRKSDYLSDRTAALSCSAAARDIPRKMVSKLKNPEMTGTLLIRAMPFVREVEFQWTLP